MPWRRRTTIRLVALIQDGIYPLAAWLFSFGWHFNIPDPFYTWQKTHFPKGLSKCCTHLPHTHGRPGQHKSQPSFGTTSTSWTLTPEAWHLLIRSRVWIAAAPTFLLKAITASFAQHIDQLPHHRHNVIRSFRGFLQLRLFGLSEIRILLGLAPVSQHP